MSSEDYAAIEVDGLFLDAWQEYSFDSDIFTPADAFRLTIGVGISASRGLRKNLDTLRKSIYAGAVVKFYVGHGGNKALQGTGVIDARDIESDEDGTKFTCEGRDFAAYLVDSAAPPSIYEKDTTFVELCRAAVEPWGLTVKADAASDRIVRTGEKKGGTPVPRLLQNKAQELGIPARKLSQNILDAIDKGTLDPSSLGISTTAIALTASKLSPLQIYTMRVKEAQPQSGETVWEFLDRHAKRLGIMMRMGPDGTLTLTGIDYGQKASHRLVRRTQQGTFVSLAFSENNILSGGERYDGAKMYREVTVYGRGRGSDAPRRRFQGTARDAADDAIPHEKTLIIHDDSVRSDEEAVRRAYRELARSRQGSQVLQYVVRGHGQGGKVYATDTVVQVDDDIAGVSGPFYVVGRTFTRSLSEGPKTTIKLMPLGSIALGEVSSGAGSL